MSKTTDLIMTLDELIRCAETLIDLGKALRKCVVDLREVFSGEPEAKQIEKKEPEKAYSFEEVRGILADLAGRGHREEVRLLLKKYGAEKLKDLEPESYSAVIREAQVMDDA